MNTNTYVAVCPSSSEYVDNLRSRLNLRNGSVLPAYEYDQQESASNPITAEGSKWLMDSLSSGSMSKRTTLQQQHYVGPMQRNKRLSK